MFLWLHRAARAPWRDRRSIRSFRDVETKAIFEQRRVKRFRGFDRAALRRLVQIDSAEELRDLAPMGVDQADQTGARSVPIDKRDPQRRVWFRWRDGDAFDVGIGRLRES
ncbi:MAG TPA: hypothetical protein VKS01_10250 [Bryobacteraceae bacterium]|nr:hypothetical protein [Bryobacteraceae bacterium]